MSDNLPTLEKGQIYHIYNQGNNKERIFINEENRRFFLELFKQYISPICDVYAYCLLRNHFHFLLKFKDDSKLENGKLHYPFSHFFNAYAQAFNKEQGRSGSLFRARFKRTLITDEDHFITALLYVHLNPVKHKFANSVFDFHWSSYNAYFNEAESWLKKKFVLSKFEGKDNFAAAHLQRKDEIIAMRSFEDWGK